MSDDHSKILNDENWLQNLLLAESLLQSDSLEGIWNEDPQAREIRQLLSNLQDLYRPHDSESSDHHDPCLPGQIGPYQVKKILGAGGFAVVYLAEDQHLKRLVALKVPLPARLVNRDSRERFLQEGRAAAQLDHPGIVPAYEAGYDGRVPFIAYAYCPGPTLATWLAEYGPLPPRQAAAMLVRLADAVEYSHQRGILHRDIKPANVLLFPPTQPLDDGLPFLPRLTDFGLAKVIEQSVSETRTSIILGTPLYLAPEQLGGNRKDSGPATDVYGLGILLFEMLAGQPNFNDTAVTQILDEIRTGRSRNLRALQNLIPEDLIIICEKALQTDPADRFPSAAAMKADLQRFLNGEPIDARPQSWSRRIIRFCQMPERIREAALFDGLTHGAIGLWVIILAIEKVIHPEFIPIVSLQEALPYSIPISMLHGAGIYLSWRVAHRRLPETIITILVSGTLSLWLLLILANLAPPPYPVLYDNQLYGGNLVFSLLMLIFILQAVVTACAALAILKERSRERLSNIQ